MDERLDADRVVDESESTLLTKISQRIANDEIYRIRIGKAVVINNIEFEARLGMPDQKGSDLDASILFQKFQELDFDSDLLNDATTQDIEDKIKEIKDDEDLRKTDCLVFVFLTHGNEEHIFATDGQINIRKLMNEFNAENSPELIMKPKIFIFVTDRGYDIGRGVNVRVVREKEYTEAAARETRENYKKVAAKETTKYVEANSGMFSNYHGMYGETIRIPNEADFLAIYCTSFGNGSFRNTHQSSPFVRVFSEELIKMEQGEDFFNLSTRVNRRVGEYKPNYPGRNDFTQMPCFTSHLTKRLILKQ